MAYQTMDDYTIAGGVFAEVQGKSRAVGLVVERVISGPGITRVDPCLLLKCSGVPPEVEAKVRT